MEATYALNENKTLQEIKRPPRIGFIKTFAGTTPPEGTLLCDGSAVSRDTYSDLFDVIGTTWGEGDGTNTFNLPDLRDVWILCAGTTHETGETIEEGLPNIEGTFAVWGGTSASEDPTQSFYRIAPFQNIRAGSTGAYDCGRGTLAFDASRSSAVYGASDHVTPKSTVLTPCIIYE